MALRRSIIRLGGHSAPSAPVGAPKPTASFIDQLAAMNRTKVILGSIAASFALSGVIWAITMGRGMVIYDL